MKYHTGAVVWASVRECPPKRRWTELQVGDPYDLAVQRVIGVEPIFVVSDVPRAVAHDEQLGFSTSHHDEGYALAAAVLVNVLDLRITSLKSRSSAA